MNSEQLLEINKEENKKVIKNLLINFLFSILFLMFVFVCFCLVLFNFYLKSPNIFGLFWCIIIMFGIIIDQRFSNLRKFMIVILNIIQIIIFIYLDFLSILLLKDIFWFSAILNMSFIWHILILPWSYNLCEFVGLDYICFIISRLSLLTSLSGILLILKSLHLLLTNIIVYFDTFYIKTKCNISYNINLWRFISLNFIDAIELIYLILHYFIKVFNNYSLFLLGSSNKFSFSKILENYKYIIFIFVIFIISIIISIPRLYILWCSLLIWNWLNLALKSAWFRNKGVWPNIKSIKELWSFFILFLKGFLVSRDFLYDDIIKYSVINNWILIYSIKYISSYMVLFERDFFKRYHCGYLKWDAEGESWPEFNYFNIIKLFIYDKIWKAKLKAILILKATGYSEYEEYEECIDFNCQSYSFSRYELCQAIRPDNIKDRLKFCIYPAENKGISLCDYLFLCDGYYVIGLYVLKKNQCIY